MKKLLLFAILTMLCIGCSQGDQPLTEDEASAVAPERETTILQLVSNTVFFKNQFSKEYSFVLPSDNSEMITPVGTPTDVYVVVQGQLTKQERIFQREMYQFLWCYLNGNLVLVNVLDNQIHYISDNEDWEHIKANWDEWNNLYDKLSKERGSTKGIETLVEATMSKKPFFLRETIDSPGDKIEVVIKHQFLYKYGRNNDKEKTMLFVDVKRNITRPHITFPQPLLPN